MTEQACGKRIWDIFLVPEEKEQFVRLFQQIGNNPVRPEYESLWVARDGSHRTIAWSAAVLPAAKQTSMYIITSGIDFTE